MTLVSKIACSAVALSFAGAVLAADPPAVNAAKTQYDAERARCKSGTTGQDEASCLKSAGAAYDESRQNRLKDPNSSFRDNALARCRTLSGADRDDCRSRVDGAGTASGSVEGGGVVKETVTTSGPTTAPR